MTNDFEENNMFFLELADFDPLQAIHFALTSQFPIPNKYPLPKQPLFNIFGDLVV